MRKARRCDFPPKLNSWGKNQENLVSLRFAVRRNPPAVLFRGVSLAMPEAKPQHPHPPPQVMLIDTGAKVNPRVGSIVPTGAFPRRRTGTISLPGAGLGSILTPLIEERRDCRRRCLLSGFAALRFDPPQMALRQG